MCVCVCVYINIYIYVHDKGCVNVPFVYAHESELAEKAEVAQPSQANNHL